MLGITVAVSSVHVELICQLGSHCKLPLLRYDLWVGLLLRCLLTRCNVAPHSSVCMSKRQEKGRGVCFVARSRLHGSCAALELWPQRVSVASRWHAALGAALGVHIGNDNQCIAGCIAAAVLCFPAASCVSSLARFKTSRRQHQWLLRWCKTPACYVSSAVCGGHCLCCGVHVVLQTHIVVFHALLLSELVKLCLL